MKKIVSNIILILSLVLFANCESGEGDNPTYVPPEAPKITSDNDRYLYENNGNSLFERYGTAPRWRWNDNFVSPTQRATPIKSDLVIPATKLIEHLWVEPYTNIGQGGQEFMEELFPAEIVYVGSFIFNTDGTILLGFAEGGARVTLLNLNNLDFTNQNWLANPRQGILATVHHEFSHIVHQNYGIPVGFNTISESYVGNQWINISRDDAIKLGIVSNYGSLNEFEDFCEMISHFLVLDEATFQAIFINQQDCAALATIEEVVNCRELNQGRLLIKQKLDLVIEFYKTKFNIDLLEVKATFQSRLNNLIATGEIPD